MTRNTLWILGAAALLAGCGNPADNTADAEVGAAKEAGEAAVGGTAYAINAEASTIGFTGSKITGSHSGGFNAFSGTITVADGKIASPSSVEIDMNSTWSDSDKLTGHLKSPDFFDVAAHPTSTFTFISSEPADGGHKVTGNLNLHGVEKSVSFPAQIAVADGEVHLTAEFDIKRFDFDIVYKGRADDLIRDEVVIKLDVKATAGG